MNCKESRQHANMEPASVTKHLIESHLYQAFSLFKVIALPLDNLTIMV